MRYASQDGHVVEYLWNSRDGVTPFGIRSRDKTINLFHDELYRDLYDPRHRPQIGDRIFEDMTEARARVYAQRVVDEGWDRSEHPMSATWSSHEDAVNMIQAEYWHSGEAPDIIIVDQQWLDDHPVL